MSSTPEAPWSASFQAELDRMESPEFVLATLAPSDSSTRWAPRARYCIFRGMWASLPENDRNPAKRNPAAWTSDLPTFTTDARMEKAAQLFAGGETPDVAVRREGSADGSASGGGAPVEAVWWVRDPEVMAQWRVRGTAWILGPDVGGEGPAAVATKRAVQARMRKVGDGEWSWPREVTAHFGNVSPGMRGTFKNPPPGRPKDGEPDQQHALGQKVEDLEDEIARANFRVGVILPERVERVDLKDPERARRTLYTLTDGKWAEEEQWP